uniref:Uncharacterized protein n=1 Tax=Arundo donax TaxID=35708 RepID=A0A0A9I377_ARUDO
MGGCSINRISRPACGGMRRPAVGERERERE